MHCNRILKFEKKKKKKINKQYILFFLIILFLISLSHGAEQILNSFFGVSIELDLCNNILYYYYKIPQV